MLKDQSVVERRRSLCLALLKSHLTEWIDSTDGMEFGMSFVVTIWNFLVLPCSGSLSNIPVLCHCGYFMLLKVVH